MTELSVQTLSNQLDVVSDKLKDVRDRLGDTQNQIERNTKNLITTNDELLGFIEQTGNILEQNEKLENRVREAEIKRDELESQTKRQSEEISQLQGSNKKLQEEILNSSTQISEQQKKINSIESQLASLTVENQNLKKQVEDANTKIERELLQYSDYAEKSVAAARVPELEIQITQLNTNIRGLQETNSQLNQRILSQKKETDVEFQKRLQEYEDEARKQRDINSQLSARISSLEKSLQQVTGERDDAIAKYNNVVSQNQDLQRQLSTTEAMYKSQIDDLSKGVQEESQRSQQTVVLFSSQLEDEKKKNDTLKQEIEFLQRLLQISRENENKIRENIRRSIDYLNQSNTQLDQLISILNDSSQRNAIQKIQSTVKNAVNAVNAISDKTVGNFAMRERLQQIIATLRQ